MTIIMEKVYTKNAPDAIGPYSQAIKANGLVFTSGQIAINPASGQVEAETIEAQTEQVCTNLKNVLEAAGSSLEKQGASATNSSVIPLSSCTWRGMWQPGFTKEEKTSMNSPCSMRFTVSTSQKSPRVHAWL